MNKANSSVYNTVCTNRDMIVNHQSGISHHVTARLNSWRHHHLSAVTDWVTFSFQSISDYKAAFFK